MGRALAESRQEGEVKATRKAVLRLSRSCQLEVSADFEKKLDAIDDLDRLYQILEQVPRVKSIDKLKLD